MARLSTAGLDAPLFYRVIAGIIVRGFVTKQVAQRGAIAMIASLIRIIEA
jgi:hypothetical protein